MCGIVGVYFFDRERPVDEARLHQQTQTLNHRGPDGGAVFVAPGVGLGHRRLSIIDLDAGQQPMFDASGRYVVVFNGEIYNYRELAAELEAAGHRFRTSSDTEVLLAGYAEWGRDLVSHLNGMFAFALYDRVAHTLFLARDPLGKKPLFVYQDADRIVFASELKALAVDPMIPRQIDATSVADFFALAYVPAPKTIYRHIRKLPAASWLFARPFESVVQRGSYWDVDYREPDLATSAEHHADNLLELLEDAVRLRLRSDVPLGAFLSGGVDSSAVVGLMARISTTPVITQVVGFDVSTFDERSYAADIAKRFETQHHEQVLSPDAGQVVQQLSYFFDEPFGDSSAIPTYYLCEQTRKLVTVALSGDGGDELFAGYDHYPMAAWSQQIHERLPELVWRAAAIPFRHLLNVSRYKRTWLKKNRLGLAAAAGGDRGAYYHLLPQPFRYRELLSEELLSGLGDYDPFDSIAHHYARAGRDDLLTRMQYADTKCYLSDDILVKVDRASMAHALEVRCPLLDHRVVSYAARIPPIHKLENGKGKRILKRAIESLIPSGFFDREKQGFAIPQDAWFQSAWRGPAEELLLTPGRGSGLLGQRKLRRAWSEHQHSVAKHGAALYNAMMFELWHARHVERRQMPFVPTDAMRRASPVKTLAPPAVESSSSAHIG